MTTEFQFREEHLTLLRAMADRDPDAKRPYGNSDIGSDVCEILGWEPTPENEESGWALHGQTSTALDVILSARTMRPGSYETDDNEEWELIAPASVILSECDATELAMDEGIPVAGYTTVAITREGEGRWVSYHQLVIRHEDTGDLFATTFERGLTESVDVPLFGGAPVVEFVPVRARERTITDYVPV